MKTILGFLKLLKNNSRRIVSFSASYNSVFLLLSSCFLLTNIFLFLNFFPLNSVLGVELRIILTGILVFFLPGLLFLYAGFIRLRSLMEALGISTILSLIFCMFFIFLAIFFQARITFAVYGFFLFSLFLCFFAFWRNFLGKTLPKYGRFNFFPHEPYLLILYCFLAVPAFLQGTDLFLNHGEMLLHLAYTRNYFDAPLDLKNLGFAENTYLPNLINFWEAILAFWATISNTDPYDIFFRARYIATLIGLIGLNWMINLVFPKAEQNKAIICGSIILVITWFFLLGPSPWDWIREQSTRGIFCFYPLAGHSDTAIDMLIPLGCAFSLFIFRNRGFLFYNMFFLFLFLVFLWHPREFFQFSLYTIFYIIILFAVQRKHKKLFILRMAPFLACFLLVALFFASFNHLFASGGSHSYDEWAIKLYALKSSFSWKSIFGFSNPFRFPNDWIPLPGSVLYNPRSDQNFLWLFFTSFALCFIFVWGNFRMRILGYFFLLLWLFTLVWTTGTLVTISATYSEFIMTSLRILYIFSYLIIPAGFLIFFQKLFILLNHFSLNILYNFIFICIIGFLLGYFWPRLFYLNLLYVQIFLTIFLFASLIYSFFVPGYFCRKVFKNERFSFISILMLFCFFVFLCLPRQGFLFSFYFGRPNTPFCLYSNKNPFGLSDQFCKFLRTLPPHSTVLVDPLGNDSVNIYAPLFLAVFPFGVYQTINRDVETITKYREGTHVLNSLFNGELYSSKVIAWLEEQNVDFIFFKKKRLFNHSFFYTPYRVVFSNRNHDEFVLSFQNNISDMKPIDTPMSKNPK